MMVSNPLPELLFIISDFCLVARDLCEVQMMLSNPLPELLFIISDFCLVSRDLCEV